MKEPAVSQARCAHCDLEVPEALIRPDAELQFCCEGCRAVHEAIIAGGLEAYYKIRGEDEGSPARRPTGQYEEMDDPAFAARYCEARPDGLMATDFYLEGIHCTACLWLVEKSLESEDGVTQGRLDFGRRRLQLMWRPGQVKLSDIAARLDSLGYPPHPARDSRNDPKRKEERKLLIRIAVAMAVMMNVMLFAMSLYSGWISGMSDEFRSMFRWYSLVVSLPAVLYSAYPFFRGALNGLKHGVLHMDLPISIGILAGFLGGAVNTIRDAGEVYFDSVTSLIFLLLLGRWLQLKQQHRATERSELIHALTPASAERVQGDKTVRVPLEAIVVGDLLRVPVGGRVPTDGVVVEGASAVDASLLSGESRPIKVDLDSEIFGGTTNLYAPLTMRATATVREARVAKIADMVVEAGTHRAPIVQLADRIAGIFVAVVLLLAVGTAGVWAYLDPSMALDHAVSLLIVSCPCALGLATPLAISAAINKAANHGILIRSGAALEALGAMNEAELLFDKTGTLTEGQMTLIDFQGSEAMKLWVAALEADSRHPVGLALRHALAPPSVILPEVEAREDLPKGGLCGIIDGKRVAIGPPESLSPKDGLSPAFQAQILAWSKAAVTPILFVVGDEAVALMGLADRLRDDALEAVNALRGAGFSPEIISGDHVEVARAVGAQLDIPEARCLGRQTPEDKLERVKEAEAKAPVIMVGDGVNDAAALAAATVGVAVHGGAETAFQAADVFLQQPGVMKLWELIQGARRTVKVIRGNIVFSLLYNTIGATLAMTGLLHPLVAAVLMPISSLIVVTNSYRFRFGG